MNGAVLLIEAVCRRVTVYGPGQADHPERVVRHSPVFTGEVVGPGEWEDGRSVVLGTADGPAGTMYGPA
ncbi:hypothetical protein ACFYY8_12380 [Streptosporangium sp. NPDC001559]|uniref:hypothetical protein n=1 Tax=Streptosporangium sp. NPDC001559 TaxID=3366187 RepID=UPI0036F158A4